LGTPAPRTVRELGGCALLLMRQSASRQLAMLCNFAEFPVTLSLPDLSGKWTTVIHSADSMWNGPEQNLAREITLSTPSEVRLSPHSFLLLEQIQRKPEAM
jgi:Domain of unknown function (DUF3459)